MYKFMNPNPFGKTMAGDCVVRALSILFDQSWDQTYTELSLNGFILGTMPSQNSVHISYMEQHGYKMHTLPHSCPSCITVKEFSERYPNGKYLLCMGDHLVALIRGTYYDIFDSGQEIVAYYFSKD